MRRREDLLRGHVHDLDEARRRHLGAGLPAGLGHQAYREVGTGPGEVDPVEATLVEQLGARLKACDVRLARRRPGRARRGASRSQPPPRAARHRARRRPSAPSPGSGSRRSSRRSGRRPSPAATARREGAGGLSRSGRVEIAEQLGLGVARDADHGAVRLRELVDERESPRGRPVERVLGRVQDPRPPDMRIGERRLDVACATRVRDLGDGANQREVIGMAVDPQQLPRLEVDADLDDEPGVPRDALLGRHGARAYTSIGAVLGELTRGAVVASLPCFSRSRQPAR